MNFLKTYVDGLDEILGKGVPQGSIVLISGAPGTMKTSLSFHILHANARNGVRGLYVSLEQSRASLLDHTEGLGYRLADVEGSLSVLDLAALRKKLTSPTDQPWMDLFKLYAKGLRQNLDYGLLVIDSLDALEILAKFRDVRRELFDLIRWLRGLDCTTFLLAELPSEDGPSGQAFAKHKEEYLADGVVHLRLARQGEFGMQRQLRIVKMRGTRHDTGYHALVFDNGFKVTRIMA
ncbi:MAG TPA: ATPase domain-containing protein [Thermoplasmata archaeon]|nr:ATPase domain-containing protein [Thermoplasmata archaeon]